jgi:tRNA pseudouridine55 synthase
VGHLAALHRLWVSPFEHEPMVSLDEVLAWGDAHDTVGGDPPWLHPPDCGLTGLTRVDLGAADSASILHGREIRSEIGLPAGTTVRAYDAHGDLLGLLEVTPGDRLQVIRLMVGAVP